MTTAADRGWGPGWPNAQTDKIRTLRRADGVVLPVRAEVVPMVAWLCDETERRGYNLRPGECWGFANRAIRGTNSPSNHSWGLAVDLNAPANPMTSRLITDMPSWMPALWAANGWRWGGTYQNRPDAMHYEYLGTPGSASAWRPPSPQPTPKELMMNVPFARGFAVMENDDLVITDKEGAIYHFDADGQPDQVDWVDAYNNHSNLWNGPTPTAIRECIGVYAIGRDSRGVPNGQPGAVGYCQVFTDGSRYRWVRP